MFADADSLSAFSLSPSLTVTAVTFDSEKGTLSFTAQFDASFSALSQITVNFDPSSEIDERYFQTVRSERTFDFGTAFGEKFAFYDSSSMSIIGVLKICAIATIVLSWIATVMGLPLRRLSGLEALMTVQFVFLCLLWHTTDLTFAQEQLFPLRFSLGYSVFLFTSEMNSQ